MSTSKLERLDYEKAEILMRADSQVELDFRVRACAKEPWTVAWIESMAPDEWLYDVGASTGPYSLIAAKLGMSVVAIEPQPASFARLLENAAGNALNERIWCVSVALARENGPMMLRYLGTAPGLTSASARMLADPDYERINGPNAPLLHHHTLSLTLDTLVLDCRFPQPQHIKLDIDEGEADALWGGMECLKHPDFKTLMVEVDATTRDGIFAVAKEAGLVLKEEYTFRRFEKYKLEPYCLFCKPELKYA